MENGKAANVKKKKKVTNMVNLQGGKDEAQQLLMPSQRKHIQSYGLDFKKTSAVSANRSKEAWIYKGHSGTHMTGGKLLLV